MKKILLGTLTVLALSPALIFARQGEGTEVEVHKSSGHTGTYMSGSYSGTLWTGSGWTSSGRTNTGALIEANIRALHADMAKLTPEQKVELTAMIRTYLTSKGVTPTVLTQNDDMRDALKAKREAQKDAFKIKREALKEALKAKREALKAERKSNKVDATINTSRSNTKG